MIEKTKVLIVDDHLPSCNIAKLYLKRTWVKNGNIVIVHDWNTAVDLAKKQLFDIILMDIRLLWKTWIDASKEIRTHYNWDSPKIVAYTADVFAANDIANKELFDAFIIKPINRENFQNPILEVLERNPTK